uniref:T-box transcription factor 3b n=1 Tax=Cyprinus carpio TaxID=7962 RepID=A0A8C1ZVE8_CYPCA
IRSPGFIICAMAYHHFIPASPTDLTISSMLGQQSQFFPVGYGKQLGNVLHTSVRLALKDAASPAHLSVEIRDPGPAPEDDPVVHLEGKELWGQFHISEAAWTGRRGTSC